MVSGRLSFMRDSARGEPQLLHAALAWAVVAQHAATLRKITRIILWTPSLDTKIARKGRRAGPTRLRCALRLRFVGRRDLCRAATLVEGGCREIVQRRERCGDLLWCRCRARFAGGARQERRRQSDGSHADSTIQMERALRADRRFADVSIQDRGTTIRPEMNRPCP